MSYLSRASLSSNKVRKFKSGLEKGQDEECVDGDKTSVYFADRD